jgi:protein-S-isoprenylcysteine O-methyltransferase Ste14
MVSNLNGPGASDGGADSDAPKQASVVPASILLGLAAVLIVVVLIKPQMPSWLKVTIALLALLVVVALLIYAVMLFRDTSRRGRR